MRERECEREIAAASQISSACVYNLFLMKSHVIMNTNMLYKKVNKILQTVLKIVFQIKFCAATVNRLNVSAYVMLKMAL